MCKKFIVFLILLSSFCSLAFADEIESKEVGASIKEGEEKRFISYEDALSLLKSNSTDIKIADLNKRISDRAAMSAAASLWIPSISLSSNLASVGTSALEDYKWSWSNHPDVSIRASLNINSQSVINFISMDIQKAIAEFTEDQTYKSLEKALFSNYWGYSTAKAAQDSAREAYELSKKTYEDTQLKYDKGLASSLDLMNSKLTLTTQENNLLTLENNANSIYLSLKALLELDEDFITEDISSVSFVNLPEADSFYSRYLSSNKTIKNLDLSYKLAKNQYDAANFGTRLPSFSLTAGYSHAWQTQAQAYKNIGSLSFSVSLGLDGFIPGTSSFNTIEKAKDNAEISKLKLDQGYITFRNDVETNISSINSSMASFLVSLDSYSYAKEALRLSKESYENGKLSMSEYSNSISKYLESQVSLLNKVLSYSSSVYDFAVYLGEDYEDFLSLYKDKEVEINFSK